MSPEGPLRVALTVNFSPWSSYSGGGQRSTHNVATALAALGHEVTVVYTKAPKERVDVPSDLTYRAEFATFPATQSHSGALLRPAAAAFVYARLKALSRRAPFDVIHGNGDEAALLDGFERSGTRLVITPRFPSLPAELRSGAWLSSSKRWLFAFSHSRYVGLGRALRRAAAYCPTSEASAKGMRAAYQLDEKRCHVVSNGVADVYHTTPRERTDGPALFFGRLSKEKGVQVLLDALSELGPEAPPIDVIGRGPLEEAVRRAAQNADVRYSDWLPPGALAQKLSCARYAVLPSLEESFGNTVAEAMSVGTPLISTTAGSIPELVESGETGLLIRPGDAHALASALRQFATSPAQTEMLGLAARSVARERYSWSRTAERYAAVYRAVLSAR